MSMLFYMESMKGFTRIISCWLAGHVTHFAHYLESILDGNFQLFMLHYHDTSNSNESNYPFTAQFHATVLHRFKFPLQPPS